MTSVAQRIILAAPTSTDRHHESVGFDDIAAGRLDAHRPGHQHRPVRYHLDPRVVGHGLSARMTTSSSVRQPRSILPVASSQPARADSTGPNGTHWEAITSAYKPLDLKESSDFSIPAKADCTSSRDPPSTNKPYTESHNGSSTIRPSRPASQAHAGPAVAAITALSPATGVGT